MNSDKKILIAKVSSVFGIKGEVKLVVFSDEPSKLEKYDLFDSKGKALKIKLRNKSAVNSISSLGDAIVIAKIEGIDDRNKAEEFLGKEIFVERKNFSKTKKDEFYLVDLVGLNVVDMEMKKIGKVLKAINAKAGAIIEIEFKLKPLPENYSKIESFSFKNAIFPEVNLEENFIKIDLPEIVVMKS